MKKGTGRSIKKIKNDGGRTHRGCTRSPVPLSTASSITTQTADGVMSHGPTPMATRLNEIASCKLFPGERVKGSFVNESVQVNELESRFVGPHCLILRLNLVYWIMAELCITRLKIRHHYEGVELICCSISIKFFQRIERKGPKYQFV
jgi:hypothetical protein